MSLVRGCRDPCRMIEHKCSSERLRSAVLLQVTVDGKEEAEEAREGRIPYAVVSNRLSYLDFLVQVAVHGPLARPRHLPPHAPFPERPPPLSPPRH